MYQINSLLMLSKTAETTTPFFVMDVRSLVFVMDVQFLIFYRCQNFRLNAYFLRESTTRNLGDLHDMLLYSLRRSGFFIPHSTVC